jgi:hypothetical protein
MLAIRAYLLVDYQVNAEATPNSLPPAHGTRPSAASTCLSRPTPGAEFGVRAADRLNSAAAGGEVAHIAGDVTALRTHGGTCLTTFAALALRQQQPSARPAV